jgi:hypothetical protein
MATQSFAGVDATSPDAYFDAPLAECLTAAGKVVTLVGVQFLWPLARVTPAWTLDRLYSIDEFFKDIGVVDVCRGEDCSERDAIPVRHKMAL